MRVSLSGSVEREVPKDWLLEYDLELVRVEPAIDWTRVPIAERIDQAYAFLLLLLLRFLIIQ